MTNREKYLLEKLLNFPICRYLMSNTYGRQDLGERVDRHIEISKILVGYITTNKKLENNETKLWKAVHDYLAEILTDRMDEVIGFPIDETIYGSDYDIYEERFFEVIVNHIDEIENLINLKLKENEKDKS